MNTTHTETELMSTVPQVKDKTEKPTGVISKRAQQYLFVSIAVVIVLVAMFSSNKQKKPAKTAQAGTLPLVQDVNERKLTDFGSELNEHQKAADRARGALIRSREGA